MHYGIGIDIGGTKISMVIGSRKGKILARREIKTQTGKKTRACVKELIKNSKALIHETGIKRKHLLGVGICIPGPVNSQKGIVPASPHLPGWEGLPLARTLSKKLHVSVYMANDANAAAVGEMIFGQGKGHQHVIYMTVSTGVGGGIITNRRLLEGANYVAGEIGHMTIESQGERWKMGEVGCLEAYASGTAITNYVRREIKKGRGGRLLKEALRKKKLSAREIGLAAKKGDALAKKAFKRAAEYLGIGLGNLLNILNPEIVIIGGGVMKSAPPFFWKTALQSCKKRSWPQAFRSVRIVRTQLGDHVGNLGALALVFANYERTK